MKFNKLFLTALLALFTISLSFIVNAKEKSEMKHFACKLITSDGKVYQTLIMGTDWKELNSKNISINRDEDRELGDNMIVWAIFNNEELKMKFADNQFENIAFNLVNMEGKVIEAWEYEFVDGNSIRVRRINNISKGCYLLNAYKDGELVSTVKVINF